MEVKEIYELNSVVFKMHFMNSNGKNM